MIVSTVVLAWEKGIFDRETSKQFVGFINEWQARVKWQMKKGLDIAPEYRYLADFQRHVTQASVEKPAVEGRARVMEEQYGRWREMGELGGNRAVVAQDWKGCK